jgi:hypothetical protein
VLAPKGFDFQRVDLDVPDFDAAAQPSVQNHHECRKADKLRRSQFSAQHSCLTDSPWQSVNPRRRSRQVRMP